MNLESLCLVWILLFFLYCFIRFLRPPEEISRREQRRRELELERKYNICVTTGHKIKAAIYKMLLKRYKEK